MTRLFAIVDCNNFYVSCERVFQPQLRNKPVVILSNNDGCVIARSNEAKAFGIDMGVPFWKIRSFCQQHNIAVCSSNYSLYGDLSYRVNHVLQTFESRVETYSIDEAFIELMGAENINLTQYLSHIVASIQQQVGIPVAIGVGKTKTLAKIAVLQAKKKMQKAVCILDTHVSSQQALLATMIDDVWGIGKRWAKQLQQHNILTALDLAQTNPQIMRKHFNITLANTVYELQGKPCLKIEVIAPPKQSIVCSRSFGKKQIDVLIIAEALSHYCARACEKLRAQGLLSKQIQVFLNTDRHSKTQPYYSRSAQINLPQMTQDTATIIHYAKQGLLKIFKQGLAYQKVGVLLNNLTSENDGLQYDLFNNQKVILNKRAAKTLDVINQRFGKDTLYLASQKMQAAPSWQAQRKNCSPRFTTCWHDILQVLT